MNNINYNLKLQNLLTKANKNGLELIEGKFEKIQNNEFLPVMEVFFFKNSTYEDYGCFHIYNRTVRISKNDYNSILSYAKENNYKEIECNYLNGNEIIDEIILKNDKSGIDYRNGAVGGNIRIVYDNNYHVYNDGDECVDLYFTKKDDDDDFPRGYVSFYMMKRKDFEKTGIVDLHLEKFMKEN
jgi:hypothetical protein